MGHMAGTGVTTDPSAAISAGPRSASQIVTLSSRRQPDKKVERTEEASKDTKPTLCARLSDMGCRGAKCVGG